MTVKSGFKELHVKHSTVCRHIDKIAFLLGA